MSACRHLMRMPAGLALCAVLLGTGAHAFDSELWPGEGVPRFAARMDSLPLREEPVASAPIVAQHPVDPGQEISYDRTLFRTVDEGLVIARQPGRLFGRSLGDLERLSEERYYAADPTFEEIPYAPGDSFDYLQYRAEGNCLIRDRDTVFEIEGCPWEGAQATADDFELARQPVTEWWIEVTDAKGEALGWLQLDRQTVDPLPRGF